MSIDYNQLPPPLEGDLPSFWKGTNAGDFVEGVITDVRIVSHNEYGDAPCVDINTGPGPDGQPIIVPVLASTNSLYRQVYALRPEVGGLIRVTFKGMSGRAKIYDVLYHLAGTAPAPAAQPAPASPPMAVPAPMPDAGAAPFGNATAAPPWGP